MAIFDQPLPLSNNVPDSFDVTLSKGHLLVKYSNFLSLPKDKNR